MVAFIRYFVLILILLSCNCDLGLHRKDFDKWNITTSVDSTANLRIQIALEPKYTEVYESSYRSCMSYNKTYGFYYSDTAVMALTTVSSQTRIGSTDSGVNWIGDTSVFLSSKYHHTRRPLRLLNLNKILSRSQYINLPDSLQFNIQTTTSKGRELLQGFVIYIR